MRDDDRLLDLPDPEFGSGVVGVCDICGTRQAVVVLSKERYQLCVLDFLNKTWIKTEKKPSSPPPIYRSDRIFYETSALPARRAPAIVLTPTKVARRPSVLIVPDIFGITTTLLDAGIRFARDGFEVLIPDLTKTEGVATGPLLGARTGARFRGGVRVPSKEIAALIALYRDATQALAAREMVDPARTAVFGTAFGASVALALAAESTRFGAVALAYPWPVRPAALSQLVSAPTFVLAGGADRTAARAVAELRAAPPTGGLAVAEITGARAQFLARDLRGFDLRRAEEGWARLTEFLRNRMLPPPPTPPPPPAKPVDPLAAPPSPTAKAGAA